MAPRVNKNTKLSIKKKNHPAEQAIAEIKKHVEENSHYVGKEFAKEARAMHLGDLPERPIYGEAKAEEAKSLIEQNSGDIIINVTKKLDYLIICDKPTKRKVETAKELKIKILNQSDLLRILNKGS